MLSYDAGVVTQVARGEPRVLAAATIGAAWLAVAARILAEGVQSRYDDLPVQEIAHVTLAVAQPDPDDAIIARHADPERLAWMHATSPTRPGSPRWAGRTATRPGCSTMSIRAGTRWRGSSAG